MDMANVRDFLRKTMVTVVPRNLKYERLKYGDYDVMNGTMLSYIVESIVEDYDVRAMQLFKCCASFDDNHDVYVMHGLKGFSKIAIAFIINVYRGTSEKVTKGKVSFRSDACLCCVSAGMGERNDVQCAFVVPMTNVPMCHEDVCAALKEQQQELVYEVFNNLFTGKAIVPYACPYNETKFNVDGYSVRYKSEVVTEAHVREEIDLKHTHTINRWLLVSIILPDKSAVQCYTDNTFVLTQYKVPKESLGYWDCQVLDRFDRLVALTLWTPEDVNEAWENEVVVTRPKVKETQLDYALGKLCTV